MMEYSNRHQRSTNSSSPWINNLPYNALSEEGSYGSFALYAPSPLPSPMHLSSISNANTGAAGLPFPSRNDQFYGERRSLPRHLTRSISSSEGLRRHRRPLSELFSTTEDPPRPFPAYQRRQSLSHLMAGSLDFDRPLGFDEEMNFHQTHSHKSGGFLPHLEPSPNVQNGIRSSHYNMGTSHHGYLLRASSDRFDLDPMIRSSFDQSNYHGDPITTPYYSNVPVQIVESNPANDEIIGADSDGMNEHSYKKMQYLRARFHTKAQGMPLSSLNPVLETSQNHEQINNSPFNVDQNKPLRDMPSSDLQQIAVASKAHLLHQHGAFKDQPYDQNGAQRYNSDQYNTHKVPSFDLQYGGQHGAFKDPSSYDHYGAAAQNHSLDQYSEFIKDPSHGKHHNNGTVAHVHGPRKVFNDYPQEKMSSTQAPPVASKHANQSPNGVGEMKASMEMNIGWSEPMNLNHDLAKNRVSQPVSEMKDTGVPLESYELGSYGNINTGSKYRESWINKPFQTKGQSILDNVTEDIVRKLTLSSSKYINQHSWTEAVVSSAKLLFKRVLVVQIQALAPKFIEISSNQKKLGAQKWALQGSIISVKQGYLSHRGLCLLHLQKVFYEIATSTFDLLIKIRDSLHEMLIKPNVIDESGQLRIACVGGGPGCSALALRLFFLMIRPSLQVKVDVCAADEYYKQIIEEMSFKGIEFSGIDIFQMMRMNPSLMRYYKVLILVNCLSEAKGEPNIIGLQWKGMWDILYENASAGAVIVVYESLPCRWEDIAPTVGQWQFASVSRGLDCVRIAKKL